VRVLRCRGSNREGVHQNNNLVTVDPGESNAYPPMLVRHWFGLSTYPNKFRLLAFAMIRSRGALQQSSIRFAAFAPFQMQHVLDSGPFFGDRGLCCFCLDRAGVREL
jgi:hypothetical protein